MNAHFASQPRPKSGARDIESAIQAYQDDLWYHYCARLAARGPVH